MAERTSVLDLSGNNEETVLQWAKDLGTNKIRRSLFNTVYGRGEKPRSKKQIMQGAKLDPRMVQQAQNQLDHLASTHLIIRMDNDGSVEDRSRYLYRKDPSVRKNRKRIIRFADDRKAAARVATKRRPLVRGISSTSPVTRQALRKKKRLNVLYLTANPDQAHSLRVDAEVRQVQDAVRGSPYRDNISLEYRPAADLGSLIEGLNDHRPRIVHFSGHGDYDGIAVDSAKVARRPVQTVSFELLAKALSATDAPPDIIVLNACKSAGARKAFLPPAKVVIVMRDSISDLAATAFAAKFYAAIAAGQSVKSAFAQGKVAVEIASINEADTPDLFFASGVDPAKIILT
jgi:CHAT domain